MADDLTNFDVSHLDALARIEADQRVIQALSEKAAARRVREAEIYTRVMADYQTRLAALVEQAAPIRQRLLDDLHRLGGVYDAALGALERAKAQLQECEFRHEIGEFASDEFERCQQTAEKAIAECETHFGNVRALRERYLALLPDASSPQAAAPKQAAAPASSSAPPRPPAAEAPAVPSAPQPTALPGNAQAPVSDHTMFLRPPQAGDFDLPASTDPGPSSMTGEFHTVAISPAVLIEEHDGIPGTRHRLGPYTTIGRTPDNQIVLPFKEVSRRHAEIVVTAEGYQIKDLDSPNGTFVNGKRITEHLLAEGDRIVLAKTTLIFTSA